MSDRETVYKEDMACIATTLKAIGVRPVEAPDDEDLTWIPRSHLKERSEVRRKGDEGTVAVSRWIAIKKGWADHPDSHAKADSVDYRFRRPKDY